MTFSIGRRTTNTTLPVVVNGFFALSESRRDLKLETRDDHSEEVRPGDVVR